MEIALAIAAAAVASAFTAVLVRSHVRRPRPHAAVWSVAMGMYALATSALAWGLAAGWGSSLFRVFFLFGAILNVMFLALGAAYLVAGPRTGAVLLLVFSAFGAGASAVTLTADFEAPLSGGVPSGSEVFAAVSEGIASPRLWALVGNTVGTVLLVGLAIYSIVRSSNRAVVRGNWLIVAGAVAPAIGGSLTALGEGAGLAASLLAGAVLLWAGYHTASGGRLTAVQAVAPPSP